MVRTVVDPAAAAQEAFRQLTAVRACNPRLLAVRQAACDILFDGGSCQRCRISTAAVGSATQVQVQCQCMGRMQSCTLLTCTVNAKSPRGECQQHMQPKRAAAHMLECSEC